MLDAATLYCQAPKELHIHLAEADLGSHGLRGFRDWLSGCLDSAALARLTGAVLAELHGEWKVADRRYLSEASMPELLSTDSIATFTGSAALLRRGWKTA